MKIAMVITCLARGGAEVEAVKLALRFDEMGHRVLLVSLLPGNAFREQLEVSEIPVKSLGMARGVPNPAAVFRLSSLLNRFEPDVVHSHCVHANLLARMTRLVSRRIPVLVCTAHSVSEGGLLRMAMYRVTDFLADHTTCVCQKGVETYIKRGAVPSAERISMMPNGQELPLIDRTLCRKRLVDEFRFHEEDFVWVSVARFHPPKDHTTLIRAFEVLRRSSRARLLLVGDGPLLTTVRTQVKKVGLAEDVVFTGSRTDVMEIVAAADGFVLSSRLEGLPMTLLEAAACRTPVVASDVGGTGELITDGVNGYLARAGSVNGLAEKMLRLMNEDAERLKTMTDLCHDTVRRKFEIQATAARWIALYTKLHAVRSFKAS